jgi:transposase
VDDWAWRKGYGRYGAILVDLQRRKVADLLPECSAVALEEWLRQHPGVKIISRDRQGSLAEGGRRGAPKAKQVADRFHLIENLQQAVQMELARQRVHLSMPAAEFPKERRRKEGGASSPEATPSAVPPQASRSAATTVAAEVESVSDGEELACGRGEGERDREAGGDQSRTGG